MIEDVVPKIHLRLGVNPSRSPVERNTAPEPDDRALAVYTVMTMASKIGRSFGNKKKKRNGERNKTNQKKKEKEIWKNKSKILNYHLRM